MDQGTPPNFYLTLCLYVSFYFLFFSSTSNTASPLNIPITVPTEQELKDKRRAKSHSEQLDPFLAATRQAQAAKQAKGIAKARARATFGTITGGYHSRQHSTDPSSAGHSRQHSRQKSHHSQINYSYNTATTISIPGEYSKATRNDPLTNNHPGQDLDFQVRQHQHSRENTRLYHHQQQHHYPHQRGPLLTDPPLQPQRYRPPHRLPRNFPRQNQNRYYHFYPEAPLFRKKMSTSGATPVAATSTATTSHSATDLAGQTNGWNSKAVPEGLPPQHQHRNSIGWADGNQTNGQAQTDRQQAQVQAQAQQAQAQAQTIGHANGVAPTADLINSGTAPGRYEVKCHLEESVTPPTLLAHLRLLRLVQSLVIVDDEDLDFLFLIRSEERYLLYLDLLQQLEPAVSEIPLPPLDVALMWTVHMLAPFRYHEDILRSYSPHLLGYAFPLERYVAAIDIENPSTSHEAFVPSKEMWRHLYPEEAFDLDKDDTTRMFEIQCLWCGGTNVMDSSTYIKFRIDGMSIDCAGCGSQCSLETLSSKRLWDGIEAYRADSSVLLAGSLLSPWTGTPDAIVAQKEHHHLFFHPRIQFALDQASASLNCTWPKVIQAFQDLGPDQYYGIRPTTLARIMSSYMGLIEDRLSMDLVAGALRQRDFQKAMMVTGGLAWCQPQVLQRSLDRYKKFMLLARAESKHSGVAGRGSGGVAGVSSMAAGGGNLGAGQPGRHALVPTLDIDLAWHTHMLAPAHYRQYQLVHYGRVLNHDDTVQATSTMTKQDFVRTAELWQDLYQERYSSQQTWRGAFVLTPEKLCAGVCFPPYGVYLVWKSWRSKRKAKKLNRAEGGDGGKKRKEKKEEKKKRNSSSNEKESERSVSESETANPSLVVRSKMTSEKDTDMRIEELNVQDPASSSSTPPSPLQQPYDTKGKGKATNENGAVSAAQDSSADGALGSSSSGSSSISRGVNDSPDLGTKSLTPALGLDGRLSNWNGDAAGPDGQASCASGACIMSPWNELQDLVPYVDLQPQQQRELRRERT